MKFSNEEKKLIMEKYFPKNISKVDADFCIHIAETLELNPFKREIFFVERSSSVNGTWVRKTEPLTGRDGFLTIAHKSMLFAGIESTTMLKKVAKLDKGEWVEVTELVAEAKVFRKDTNIPTIVEVEYSEYVQKTKSGVPTKFWAQMPKTMLKKVAESQALRKAFNISGIYAIEEVGIEEEPQIEAEEGNTPAPQTPQKQQTPQDVKEALKALGLTAIERDGWVKAEGDVFQKKEILKQLGFSYNKEKKIWLKKVS